MSDDDSWEDAAELVSEEERRCGSRGVAEKEVNNLSQPFCVASHSFCIFSSDALNSPLSLSPRISLAFSF